MEQNYADIYKDLAPRVYRYALVKLGNKSEAEDITSETFLRLLTGKPLHEIEQPVNWAITVARNLIYDKFRRKVSEDIPLAEDELSSVADKDDAPVEQQAIRAELLEEIKRQLDRLDDLTREVIILRIWEEMTFEEIATFTDHRVGNVKLRFYRGVEKIKLQISDQTGSQQNAVTFPLLVAGIKQLAEFPEYSINPDLFASIAKNNIFINQTYMSKLKLLLGSTKFRALMVVLAGAILVGGSILVAYLSSQRNPAPSVGIITATVQTKVSVEPSLLEELEDKYEVIYLDGGEVYLSNLEGTDRVAITSTGGKVQKYILSPDGSKLVYTIAEPDLIEPVAADLEARLRAEQAAQGNPMSYLSPLTRNLPTRAYLVDLNVGAEPQLLIDYLEPNIESLTMLNMVPSAWTNHGIDLQGFDSTGNRIAYVRGELYALELSTSQVYRVASPTEVEHCYTLSMSGWQDDVMVLNRGCREWGQSLIMQETANGIFTPLATPQDFGGSYAGSGETLMGITADKHLVMDVYEVGNTDTIVYYDMGLNQLKSYVNAYDFAIHPKLVNGVVYALGANYFDTMNLGKIFELNDEGAYSLVGQINGFTAPSHGSGGGAKFLQVSGDGQSFLVGSLTSTGVNLDIKYTLEIGYLDLVTGQNSIFLSRGGLTENVYVDNQFGFFGEKL